MEDLIGGSKGEGKQMAVWEKIFDALNKLVNEAEEFKITSPLVTRAQEIVTFVKGKKYAMTYPAYK